MNIPLKIKGSGKHLPPRAQTSEEIDEILGVEAGTTFDLTGVRVRHRSDDLTAADMGAKAANDALRTADMSCDDIDVIVAAVAPPQQLLPCTAALIQRSLGQGDSGTTCLDIDTTCMSFLTSLELMGYAIQAGRFQNALIVSASVIPPGAADPEDPKTYALFGDGAAAFVVEKPERDEGQGILGIHTETYSCAAEACHVKGGSTAIHSSQFSEERKREFMFHMDGPRVFKEARKLLPPAVKKAMEQADCEMDDIDLCIPHQASGGSLPLIRRSVRVPEEKFVNIIEDHGNCIAASIPMALHESIRREWLVPGGRCLFLGSGAGLMVGGLVLEY